MKNQGRLELGTGQRSFPQQAGEVAFLLGGIGTGTVSLGVTGELKDWEIFNRPAKGSKVPYGFFALYARAEGGVPAARVLESTKISPHTQAHGYHPGEVRGLPHFESTRLRGEYPFVWIDFEDPTLPVQVSLEAFNPLIPLNAEASGIPGAVFRYKVKNVSHTPCDVTIAGSLPNLSGFRGYDIFDNMIPTEGDLNEFREKDGVHGLFFSSSTLSRNDHRYGNLALITRDPAITVKTLWADTGWWDGIQDFWDDFSSDGRLELSVPSGTKTKVGPPTQRVGSLGIVKKLGPGEEGIFEFALAWYFPNRVADWDEDAKSGTVRNFYATRFTDSWDAGSYLLKNLTQLEKSTRDFHEALFSSTLPEEVLDAVSSNITVIRSSTCFRIEEGTFLSYEGSHNTKGSCEGTCTHVWNYAQTLAYLFPELERTARRVEFNLETDEVGNMAFRTLQIFGKPKFSVHPAADGQLGTIVRLYREWILSGDTDFLKSVWDKAALAMDFTFSRWDLDGDLVLDGQQHNTYDIEFYGPNSLVNSLFYAALRAASEMSLAMGDKQRAQRYNAAWAAGSARMDKELWNGEYYRQKVAVPDEYSYQYGEGCLSDQLLGQWMAHVVGLGYVLPVDHVKTALRSVYQYNFCEDLKGHQNVQRVYALEDEKGVLLCTWPRGGRPRLPFVYSDEVWTGIEYQVAAHLIYEGMVQEGLSIVKAVRDRYDGYKRNPWDEVECGHHYARALASWSVLLALTGFRCDLVKGTMSFAPALNADNFQTFWCQGKAWGTYRQTVDPQSGGVNWSVDVKYGSLDGVTVNPKA